MRRGRQGASVGKGGTRASRVDHSVARSEGVRPTNGMTLVELIVAFTVLMILCSMAVPLARARVQAERSRELRRCLVEMRNAIDKYKDNCDQGYFGPPKLGTNCYPESLEILVQGQKLAQSADGKKLRFLRHVPRDPFS